MWVNMACGGSKGRGLGGESVGCSRALRKAAATVGALGERGEGGVVCCKSMEVEG